MYVCIHAHTHVHVYVRMHVCMHVCTYGWAMYDIMVYLVMCLSTNGMQVYAQMKHFKRICQSISKSISI